MKKILNIVIIIHFILICIISNSYLLIKNIPETLYIFIPVFLFICLFAGVFTVKSNSKRLRICSHGNVLLSAFFISLPVCVLYHVILAIKTIPASYMTFIWSAVFCIVAESIIFWIGIVCVYLMSVRMTVKQRFKGLAHGMIPVKNLITLSKIIKTTREEIIFESDFELKKIVLNNSRKEKELCKTKYPILLVHGVFFRDTKLFNYWGRIPKELSANGATIYYGNHQSALSIKDSAEELTERIKEIINESGCEKVNIIAHSKGGLDCRYAIAHTGAAEYIASLTTINTPHRGCEFADFLLKNISDEIQEKIAKTYNSAMKKLGDKSPDFLSAVNDLTSGTCQNLDKELTAPAEIYCQSIGSVMPKPTGGKFPLNYSYHLVKCFDGPNDGLVGETSFKWSENYTLLTPEKARGISHGDMIDLNRENIDGFDVREFYVELVNDLKERGL